MVDEVDLEFRDRVAGEAVGLAEAEPVGTFRRALRALIETVQAATLEQRHQDAVTTRRIVVEPAHDGMGVLLVYAPLVELHAIHGRATAIAKTITASPGESRTLDQVRADVVCDLLVDGTTTATPANARGIRATVVVTVPVLALLDDAAVGTSGTSGTADLPVVEGVGPIPLTRARELCGGEGSWMRVLTHPETGMVLSVGRDTYRPPAALRKLVKWRADRCMAPGCGMPASRCDIDHNTAWADGGETSLTNNAPFCEGHHTVRHHGGWTIRQLDGGVIEWTSPTGRVYTVHPERRIPVFRPDPTAGAEPAPPF